MFETTTFGMQEFQASNSQGVFPPRLKWVSFSIDSPIRDVNGKECGQAGPESSCLKSSDGNLLKKCFKFSKTVKNMDLC